MIPTIAAQVSAKTPVLRLGSVTPVRDFLYVKDTARAFVLACKTDGIEGETIHVGTGVGVTIGELAERMMAAAGHIVPIETDQNRIRPAGSEVMRLLCNSAYAKEKMGFEAQTDLDTGLMAVHDYVQSRLDKYRPGRYMR